MLDILDYLPGCQWAEGRGPYRAVHRRILTALDRAQLLIHGGAFRLVQGIDRFAFRCESTYHQPVGIQNIQRLQAQRQGVGGARLLLVLRAYQPWCGCRPYCTSCSTRIPSAMIGRWGRKASCRANALVEKLPSG